MQLRQLSWNVIEVTQVLLQCVSFIVHCTICVIIVGIYHTMLEHFPQPPQHYKVFLAKITDWKQTINLQPVLNVYIPSDDV